MVGGDGNGADRPACGPGTRRPRGRIARQWEPPGEPSCAVETVYQARLPPMCALPLRDRCTGLLEVKENG